MDEEEISAEIASAVTPAIEDAVASAVVEQAHREEVAGVIADAALEGERGRRIENVERELAECQQTIAELPTLLAEASLSQMQAIILPLTERLSAVEGALSVMAPNPTASAPLTLVEEAAPATAETVAPVEVPVVEVPTEEEPEPPVRKKRFRSI